MAHSHADQKPQQPLKPSSEHLTHEKIPKASLAKAEDKSYSMPHQDDILSNQIPSQVNERRNDEMKSALRWICAVSLGLDDEDSLDKSVDKNELDNLCRAYRMRHCLRKVHTNRDLRTREAFWLPDRVRSSAEVITDALAEHSEGSSDEEGSGNERKIVSIGDDFQATLPSLRPRRKLPEGEAALENDEEGKWISQRVWTPAEVESKPNRDAEMPGSFDFGLRAPVCHCGVSAGSTDCVQKHVKEADYWLKAELGQTYFLWGLQEAGEKYAARWSKQEEDNFKATVRWCPKLSGRNFWSFLERTVPQRRRRELVAYYFNVFLLRKRAEQNRLFPRVVIDSDNDDDPVSVHAEWGDQGLDMAEGLEREGGGMEGMEGIEEAEGVEEYGQGSGKMEEVDDYFADGDGEDEEWTVVGRRRGEKRIRKDLEAMGGKKREAEEKRWILGLGSSAAQREEVKRREERDEETDLEDSDEEQAAALQPWRSASLKRQEEELKQACGNLNGGMSLCGGHPVEDYRLEEGLVGASSAVVVPYEVGSWNSPLDFHGRGMDEDQLTSTSAMMKEFFG